ncbi:hypothetical protein HZS_3526 [Henneguya salminicola]|nr:hypothetical protein HZS_3526 [Henneguya salminicola]
METSKSPLDDVLESSNDIFINIPVIKENNNNEEEEEQEKEDEEDEEEDYNKGLQQDNETDTFDTNQDNDNIKIYEHSNANEVLPIMLFLYFSYKLIPRDTKKREKIRIGNAFIGKYLIRHKLIVITQNAELYHEENQAN